MAVRGAACGCERRGTLVAELAMVASRVRATAALVLCSVLQCALLEPAVMPAVPRVISAGAASSSVGLMGDLGL